MPSYERGDYDDEDADSKLLTLQSKFLRRLAPSLRVSNQS